MQHPSIQQYCQNLQKGALNLTEIQHEDRHGNHMSSGFLQLCSNQSHAAFPFRQTEPALYFHTLALIPVLGNIRYIEGYTPSKDRKYIESLINREFGVDTVDIIINSI